jgi:hypothetical protein
MSLRFSYHTVFPARWPAETDVAACEESLGVQMPLAFRRFLLEHNGPMPDPPFIRIGDRPEWVGPMISFFTVIDTSSPRARRDTIESYTTASRVLENLPENYLCIGLLLRQPSTLLLSAAGAVSAWRVVPRRRFDPSQVVHVADTFEGLLAAFAHPPAAVLAADPKWERDLRRVRSAPVCSPE